MTRSTFLPDFKFGPLSCKTLFGQQGDDWTRYLTRVSLGRLSLHIFWRGDADPECHDHPWDFWTFPLRSYWEIVPGPDLWGTLRMQKVRSWRLHFRPAEYIHRVLDHPKGKPIITLVWKSQKRREWGFWCPNGWRQWREYIGGGRGCE